MKADGKGAYLHIEPDVRELFQRPRYCATPLPPYRFAAGRNPHPTENPLGHSYRTVSEPHAEVIFARADDWRNSADYLFGCDLYNLAFWWEAHEAWEGLWRLAEPGSAQVRFLQGIIQLAAAHLKLFLERPDGVRRLRERGEGYLRSVLEEAGPMYMGIDLLRFLSATDAYFGSRPAEPPVRTAHDPTKFPYLDLLL